MIGVAVTKCVPNSENHSKFDVDISRHGQVRSGHAANEFKSNDQTTGTIDALLEVFVQTELAGALD